MNGNRLIAVGNYFGAHRPFEGLFKEAMVVNSIKELPELTSKDTLLFGGGADIWPGFYNQKPSRYNGTREKSGRDNLEEQVFNLGVAAGSNMLGICRGAQLLCALSGGSLIQHVNNHAGSDHNITTNDGKTISVCSVHHQMMNPFDTEHELIAWAEEKRSNVYIIEREVLIDVEKESEVVYFPKTKALAIQYHPEFMHDNAEGVSYAVSLVKKYLIKE